METVAVIDMLAVGLQTDNNNFRRYLRDILWSPYQNDMMSINTYKQNNHRRKMTHRKKLVLELRAIQKYLDMIKLKSPKEMDEYGIEPYDTIWSKDIYFPNGYNCYLHISRAETYIYASATLYDDKKNILKDLTDYNTLIKAWRFKHCGNTHIIDVTIDS